jgi:hypothetical protein
MFVSIEEEKEGGRTTTPSERREATGAEGCDRRTAHVEAHRRGGNFMKHVKNSSKLRIFVKLLQDEVGRAEMVKQP